MNFDYFDCWKAITLYRLNVAIYKPALATWSLKWAGRVESTIFLEDLSAAFLKECIFRFEAEVMRQLASTGSRTKLRRILQQLGLGALTFSRACVS